MYPYYRCPIYPAYVLSNKPIDEIYVEPTPEIPDNANVAIVAAVVGRRLTRRRIVLSYKEVVLSVTRDSGLKHTVERAYLRAGRIWHSRNNVCQVGVLTNALVKISAN